MAAPYPPQGAQKQYTERPLKIFGERYLAAAALPVGVVTTYPGDPPIFSDAQPRALTPAGWIVVREGDWIVSNRYTGAVVEVLSNEEFSERFGGGPNVVEGT